MHRVGCVRYLEESGNEIEISIKYYICVLFSFSLGVCLEQEFNHVFRRCQFLLHLKHIYGINFH